MNNFVRTLTIIYDVNIDFKQITSFRGAVVAKIGDGADILYHNHYGDKKLRYSYPLIQYKRLRGQAAIVCVNQGADVIGQFLSTNDKILNIVDQEIEFNVAKVVPFRILMQTWKRTFKYALSRWLPLNAKNYRLYQMAETDEERKSLLESVLVGNLLSMLKGLDIHAEDRITVKIEKVDRVYATYNKGIGLLTFDLVFTSNLTIPNNVGIGKNASIGYGIVKELKSNNNQNIKENE